MNYNCYIMYALTDLPVYDCGDVKTQGNTYSGVYQVTIADRDVRPTGGKINVYCDMTTDGGAWTVRIIWIISISKRV